VSTPSSFIAG